MTMEILDSPQIEKETGIESLTLAELNRTIKLTEDKSMNLADNLSAGVATLSHEEFMALSEEMHECITQLENLRERRRKMTAEIIQ